MEHPILLLLIIIITLTSFSSAAVDERQPPILVESGPQEFPPYDKTVDATIKLPCVATGIPEPEYEWRKNDISFQLNHESVKERGEDGTIFLDKSMDVAGYYQCIALNMYGKAQSNKTNVQIAQLESISTSVYSATKKNGEGHMMPCHHVTHSVPDPTYDWIIVNDADANDKKSVIENSRILVGLKGGLYFLHLTPEDQRDGYTYKCQARNGEVGTVKEGSPAKITVTQDVPVTYLPVVISDTPQYSALEGETVSLDCIFSAYPEIAELTWNSRNVPLDRIVKTKSGTRLTISDVQLQDAGVFQCWARNDQGTSETVDIELIVEARPTFLPDGELQDVQVVQHDTAKFVCKGTGVPAPTVDWYIDGVALNPSDPGARRSLADGDTSLVITNACKDYCTTTDLFNVQCNVTNVHGYQYRGASLNVLLPTIVTVSPQAVHIGDNTSSVLLSCTAVTDPLLRLAFKWLHRGEQLYNDTNHVVTIWEDNSLHLDLTAADDEFRELLMGEYKCVAEDGQFGGSAVAMIEAAKVEELKAAGVLEYWWVFVIIVAVLLFILIIIFWCLWCRKNEKFNYYVDTYERNMGNDPEKELDSDGFKDYVRPQNDSTSKDKLSPWEEMDDIPLDSGKITGSMQSLNSLSKPYMGSTHSLQANGSRPTINLRQPANFDSVYDSVA